MIVHIYVYSTYIKRFFIPFISQRTVISKVRPVLKKTVRALYSKENFPQYFTVADLGCSSGPNTLSPTYEMIDAVVGLCRETGHAPPELLVFLNDLPSNDFNTGFRSLPDFYNMLKKEKGDDLGPCFIAGMPGSFYGRLFPSKTLNFVHSSYSVHWLSKVSILTLKITLYRSYVFFFFIETLNIIRYLNIRFSHKMY